jgi:uncharacterized protein YbaA (DUF1428 family)
MAQMIVSRPLPWEVCTYKSKADQKRVMKKVMEYPRLSKMMDPANMPFDMSRMAWLALNRSTP